MPVSQLFACLIGDPSVKLDDGTHLFSNHDEVGGKEKAPLGVLPPHEGLEPGDVAVGDTQNGLIKDAELLTHESSTEIVLEVQDRHDLAVHFVIEDSKAVPPHGLGPVHRGIGVAKQVFRTFVVGVPEGDADADGRKDLGTVEIEGNPELFLNSLGCNGCTSDVLDVFYQNDELVPSEAGHGVARSTGLLDPLRDGTQQSVPGDVAEAVIDVLEAVEVEKEDCKALLRITLSAGKGVPHPVHQDCAVRKAGQRILKAGCPDRLT